MRSRKIKPSIKPKGTASLTTVRTIYKVKFEGVVYLLHAFQKKSKHGIATSKQDIDLIKKRLQKAQEDYLQEIHQRDGTENEPRK